MRMCPLCKQALMTVEYEGFEVMQCGRCKGHLVSSARLKGIKRLEGKTVEGLKAEAEEQFRGSTREPVRCPRCHVTMRREKLGVPVLDLHADVCDGCELVWLDGGELALLQLGYQMTRGFTDVQTMKQRLKEIEASPARKAAFEENLKKLPERYDGEEEAAEMSAAEIALRLLLGDY